VPPAAQAPLIAVGADELTRERLARHDPAIRRLARVRELGFSSEVPKGSAQIVLAGTTFCLPLGELIDIKAEAARLEKELGKAGAEIDRIEKKLSNEKFVANAREDIVAAERERLAELLDARGRLEAALVRVREAS